MNHRMAALALLTCGANLKPKEGQFLGGIAFSDEPLTPKQQRWLDILLDRHAPAPMAAHLFAPAGRA